MKIIITAKKDGQLRQELVFSETQAFIVIQQLHKDGFKDIGMRYFVDNYWNDERIEEKKREIQQALEQKEKKKEENSFIPKYVKIYNYSDDVKEIIEIDSTGFGRSGGRKGNKSSEVSKQDRKRNLQRVKRNCRRLAFANNLGQVHLVLTYKENMQDLEKSDNDFKEFMKAIHKLYPNLKYLATREFQERGAVHYHILLNQRVNIKKVSKIWKHGFIFLRSHSNKMKAVMYVLKYISKEVGETVMTTKNGHTKKAYLSSKGLKRDLDGCILRMCINTPEEYAEYNDGVNFMMTNLTEGWDIPFEIEIGDNETDENRKICGRSILRCAANNY